MKISKRFLLPVFLGLSLATVAILLVCTPVSRRGVGVPPEQANQSFHQKIDLPSTARDVNYLSNLSVSAADFAIDESDFILWCNEHKYIIKSFSGENPSQFHSFKHENIDIIIVAEGLKFEHSANCGISGVYARNIKRASIYYSCR